MPKFLSRLAQGARKVFSKAAVVKDSKLVERLQRAAPVVCCVAKAVGKVAAKRVPGVGLALDVLEEVAVVREVSRAARSAAKAAHGAADEVKEAKEAITEFAKEAGMSEQDVEKLYEEAQEYGAKFFDELGDLKEQELADRLNSISHYLTLANGVLLRLSIIPDTAAKDAVDNEVGILTKRLQLIQQGGVADPLEAVRYIESALSQLQMACQQGFAELQCGTKSTTASSQEDLEMEPEPTEESFAETGYVPVDARSSVPVQGGWGTVFRDRAGSTALVGKGGTGWVYAVTPAGGVRSVSQLVLKATPATTRMAVREMRLNHLLRHPNIVECFFSGVLHLSTEKIAWMVLERADTPLQQCLEEKRTEQKWARELFAAIAHLHSLKIVHRDIKPANALIFNSTLKLSDLGNAKQVDGGTATASTSAAHTPLYSAPEVLDAIEDQEWRSPALSSDARDVWAASLVCTDIALAELHFVFLKATVKRYKQSAPIADRQLDCLTELLKGASAKDAKLGGAAARGLTVVPVERATAAEILEALEGRDFLDLSKELLSAKKQLAKQQAERERLEAQLRALAEKEAVRASGDFYYHGTSLAAALSIQKDGFDVTMSGSNAGAMLGDGVYVTKVGVVWSDSCNCHDRDTKEWLRQQYRSRPSTEERGEVAYTTNIPRSAWTRQ